MNTAYYDTLMSRAFAGMKADMGFDRVESHPAKAFIPFGAVAGLNSDGTIAAGNGEKGGIGIAVHSHAVTGEGYPPQTAVSVMTRGLVWAKCAENDASEAGGRVLFNAQGEIDASGSHTLPQAAIREIATAANGARIACVELHAPTVAN